MSLIRQVWLMLFGVLLIALLGSVATHTLMARQSLNTHLQVRNDDSAMMLALALSQQRGDTETGFRLAVVGVQMIHQQHHWPPQAQQA